MKILLTGASGYLGARLFFDLQKSFDVVGTYHGQQLSEKFISLDTTNEKEIERVLGSVRPEIIIHAASNANPRWCEENPELAKEINQESTRKIVKYANGIDAKIILISSFAAFSPTNVYAKTKKQSEAYALEAKNGYTILRPSLIIGFSPNTRNDRPFNRFLKNLDEKTEAVYDTSWKFQPTHLKHISEVLQIVIKRNIQNEIIPIAVQELKTRYELAKDILGHFGIEVTPIDKQDTSDVVIDNLEKLTALKLPTYSYQEIIAETIHEIEQRDKFLKV